MEFKFFSHENIFYNVHNFICGVNNFSINYNMLES